MVVTVIPSSRSFERTSTLGKIQNFFTDESGVETLEYAVIGAIIATVATLIYGSGWGGQLKQQLLNAASQSGGTVTT